MSVPYAKMEVTKAKKWFQSSDESDLGCVLAVGSIAQCEFGDDRRGIDILKSSAPYVAVSGAE